MESSLELLLRTARFTLQGQYANKGDRRLTTGGNNGLTGGTGASKAVSM